MPGRNSDNKRCMWMLSTFVITTGVCGCCPVCAKQEGEECGGDLAYRGKCDRDLDCVLTSKTIISSSLTLHNEPVGTCKKMSKKRSRGHQADAGFVEYCQPKCSPEFCAQHPRAVCSASDVVDTVIECHGKCQHTSCRACAFIEEPDCPSCQKDDFKCLNKFGRCIKKHVCSSRKKNCLGVKAQSTTARGKFVCKVPNCL
ncbi:CCN family member 3-like [Physella acuta]|uniref:CCN family member 3-like n=1 Tax=Physella acuta TaxID=109671 RepID=UPI0027DE2FCE|nr:CCN family member 3-like [Physella acuta]